ncbi:MAG: hypothetical protein AAGA54_20515 [Myxococcota bacterium]
MSFQTRALLLTLAIELPCVLALGHARGWMKSPQRLAWLLAACAATLCTHPFAWEAAITHNPDLTPEGKVARIEGAVVLAEAVLYALALRLHPLRALALSFLANTTSFLVGLLWLR